MESGYSRRVFVAPLVVAVSAYGYVGAVSLSALVARRTPFFLDGRFSWGKFYALMGWVPLSYVGLAAFVDPRYLAFFFVAAVAGIAGEWIVSVVYHRFFGAPIWTYGYGALSGGYTSTLNVLPWAFGALIFQQYGRLSALAPAAGPAPWDAIVGTGAGVIGGAALAWPLRRLTAARAHRFSAAGFAVFCAPVLGAAIGAALVDLGYLGLMAMCSAIGFGAEYAYGRIMSLFFDEPLWRYRHWRIDGGHTSFVTLPLWALGGLYFHLIAALLGL